MLLPAPALLLCRLFLLLALLARAMTPVGFMPTAISSGGLFTLCHSDMGSRLLLALVRTQPVSVDSTSPHAHHHGGHHGAMTAQVDTGSHSSSHSGSHSEGHKGHSLSFDQRCDFAASPLYAALPSALSVFAEPTLPLWQRPNHARRGPSQKLWLRPLNRAPPHQVLV
jgi:hypothetical protein